MSFYQYLSDFYKTKSSENLSNLIPIVRKKLDIIFNLDGTLNSNCSEYKELNFYFSKYRGFDSNEFINFLIGLKQSDTFLKVVFNKKIKVNESTQTKKEIICNYLNSKPNKLTPYTPLKSENPKKSRGLHPLGYKFRDKPIYFYLCPTTQSMNHTACQSYINSISDYLDKDYIVLFDDSIEGNFERFKKELNISPKVFNIDSFLNIVKL